MSYPAQANVDISTENFGDLITKTNETIELIRNNIMTANATTSNTTGNSFLIGVFSANTIAAVTALRGGTVSTPATLAVSSNLSVSGALTTLTDVTITGNVTALDVTGNVAGDNITAAATINSVQVITSGNVAIGGDLTVTGNTSVSTGHLTLNTANVTGNVVFSSLVDYVVSNTASLGANTTSPNTIFSFAKATYDSAKLVIKTKNSIDVQTQEAVLSHDGNNVYISVFGTVTTANGGTYELGEVTAAVNGANIDVRFQQNISGSVCTTMAYLFR